MNNKTLKRVVALLATALLVCSCAFAATIDDATVTYDATSGEIVVPFAPGTGATKAALLVRNERTDEIVALAQFNSLTNVVAFEETIDTEKVAVGDKLLISVGDNAAESTSAATAEYEVSAVKYTVTVNFDNGTENLVIADVEKGTNIVAFLAEKVATAPEKAATAEKTYAFDKWLVNGEEIAADATLTSDITITATYTETVRSYAVKFVNEDGTELQNTEVAYGETPVYAGETPTKAANEKYTYTFAGWTPEIAAVTGETTYTATYTEAAREYTIVFYDEDGVTVLSEQKLIYGATPVEPEAPAKEGFTFKGWDKDVVAVTGDATYTAVFEENAPEIEYASVLQNVTYNSIEGTVVRITGLDTTSVVTVDGVTAKYYTKTDGTLVHVACVPRTAEPVISVADGTPVLIKFGDVDGNGSVNGSDKIELGRRVTNFERQKPSYKKYSLPTDLMELLVHDVDGNGAVNGSDKIEVGRAVTNFERQKPSYKKYSLETMGCYTK